MTLLNFGRGFDKKRQWSQCWQQLAVMLAAGIAPDAALKSLINDRIEWRHSLSRVLGLVQRGQSFAGALHRSGCVSDFDYQLLKIAEAGGCLPAGLTYVGERCLDQLQRVKTLSAGLLLPQLILVIGALAALFIRVAAYNQVFILVFVETVFFSLLMFAFIRFSLYALTVDARYVISALWPVQFVRRRSWFFQASYELLFFRCLLWQFNAGEVIEAATLRCKSLLNAKHFQRSVIAAARSMGRGTEIVHALTKNELVLSARLRQTLNISNDSGRWEAGVGHELDLRENELKRRLDERFKWLPKLYYVLVLLFVFSLLMRY